MASDDSLSLKAAEEVVSRLKLPLPRRPDMSDQADWPGSLGEIETSELVRLLTWCKGWAAHTRWHLARVEGNLEAAEEEYKSLTMSLTFKSEGDYRTVTELKASVANAPAVAKIRKRVLETKLTAKLVRSLLEGYEDKFEAVSRELTRRGREFDDERRSMRHSQ